MNSQTQTVGEKGVSLLERFRRRVSPYVLGDTYGFTRHGTMVRWYRTHTGHPRTPVIRNPDCRIAAKVFDVRVPRWVKAARTPENLLVAVQAFGCFTVIRGAILRPTTFGIVATAISFTFLGMVLGLETAKRMFRKRRG